MEFVKKFLAVLLKFLQNFSFWFSWDYYQSSSWYFPKFPKVFKASFIFYLWFLPKFLPRLRIFFLELFSGFITEFYPKFLPEISLDFSFPSRSVPHKWLVRLSVGVSVDFIRNIPLRIPGKYARELPEGALLKVLEEVIFLAIKIY